MTEKQKKKLCEIYNSSDIDSFEYIKQFCDEEQKRILDRIIWLNLNTTIGWGEQDATSKEMDEYYEKKWILLSSFGLENIGGDAYYNGVMY